MRLLIEEDKQELEEPGVVETEKEETTKEDKKDNTKIGGSQEDNKDVLGKMGSTGDDTDFGETVVIPVGLKDEKSLYCLLAIKHHMSEGLWENSPAVMKFWKYFDIILDDSKGICISIFDPKYWENGFRGKTISEVKDYFAAKVKYLAKKYLEDSNLDSKKNWKRDIGLPVVYLSYKDKDSDKTVDVTISDAYKVYDALKGVTDKEYTIDTTKELVQDEAPTISEKKKEQEKEQEKKENNKETERTEAMSLHEDITDNIVNVEQENQEDVTEENITDSDYYEILPEDEEEPVGYIYNMKDAKQTVNDIIKNTKKSGVKVLNENDNDTFISILVGNDYFELWVDVDDEGCSWNKFTFFNTIEDTVDKLLQDNDYITEICFDIADERYIQIVGE